MGLVRIPGAVFWQGTISLPIAIGAVSYWALLDSGWTLMAFLEVAPGGPPLSDLFPGIALGKNTSAPKCNNLLAEKHEDFSPRTCATRYSGVFQGAMVSKKENWQYYISTETPVLASVWRLRVPEGGVKYRLVPPGYRGMASVAFNLNKTIPKALSEHSSASARAYRQAVFGSQALAKTMVLIDYSNKQLYVGDIPGDLELWFSEHGFYHVPGLETPGWSGLAIPVTVGGVTDSFVVDTGDATPGISVSPTILRRGLRSTRTGIFSLEEGANSSCMCQEQAISTVVLGGVSLGEVPLLINSNATTTSGGGLLGATVMEYLFDKVVLVFAPGKRSFGFSPRAERTKSVIDFIRGYSWSPKKAIHACDMVFPAGKEAQHVLNRFCMARR